MQLNVSSSCANDVASDARRPDYSPRKKTFPIEAYTKVRAASETRIASPVVPATSQMNVILPPEYSRSDGASQLLRTLDVIRNIGSNVLPKQEVQEIFMRNMGEGIDDSVRMIQADRIEVFFHDAANKGCQCFDRVLEEHGYDVTTTKTSIVDYAIQQARKDKRLSGKDMKFGNFSLILSYGPVDEQAPHVDLLVPNYQFGLLFTPSPGTVTFEIGNKIESTEDLTSAWKRADEIDRNEGLRPDPLPPGLIEALNQSRDAQYMLRGYGNVLVPDEELDAAAKSERILPAGTLLSLPGGIVHAGPRCEEFRAVMFFTAWPVENKEVAEYHPDTQYSSVFLSSRLTQLLWRQVGVGYKERMYLLQKMYRHIRQGGNKPKKNRIQRRWAEHFPTWDKLAELISELELDNTTRKKDMQLIKHVAQQEGIIFYNVLGSFDASLKGDFVKASIEGLQTKWDGKSYDVTVFLRQADAKVLLYYQTDENGHSWEGVEPTDNYRLEPMPGLDAPRAEWFDGTNGRLYDTDGELIECSQGNQVASATGQPRVNETQVLPNPKRLKLG